MRKFTKSISAFWGLINECQEYYTKNARDAYGVANKNFLAIQLLNDPKNWINAYTINVAGVLAVILPIRDPHSIRGQSRSEYPQLGYNRTIMISRNMAGEYNTESVILLTDSPTGLTGSIIPDPWLVNSLQRPHCGALMADVAFSESSKPALIPDRVLKEEPDNTLGLNYGNEKISDIKDYLKCFDNNPSSDHVYDFLVCVMQPEPGTRSPWGFVARGVGNPVDVGHTFLVATEKTPMKTVVRNAGFYPSSFVWPLGPSAKGMLNDDSYHEFNIALRITTTSHQFTQVLSYLSRANLKGYLYNLNSNNCTTFIINALREGNIILPRTTGHWTNGSGLNPGDFGEDLRELTLTSNMTLLTKYQSHPNQGSCV